MAHHSSLCWLAFTGSPQQSLLVSLYRLTPAVFTGSPQQSLRSVPQQSLPLTLAVSEVSLYRLTPAVCAGQSLPAHPSSLRWSVFTSRRLCGCPDTGHRSLHVHYHRSSCRDLHSVDHNTPLTPVAPDVRVRQLSASQWSVLDWPHMLCTLSVISSHTCQNHT